MLGVTLRLTRPSRARLREVSVGMRCETLGISRRRSLKRRGPSPSVVTTSTVHLSPMRDNKVLIVRQTGLAGSFMVWAPLCSCPTNLFLAHKKVRSCGGFARGYLGCLGNKYIPRRQ